MLHSEDGDFEVLFYTDQQLDEGRKEVYIFQWRLMLTGCAAEGQ